MEKIKNIAFITLFILLLSSSLPGCGADGTDKSDGTLIQVGTDYGHGTMFIADGRLYSQRYINRKNSVGDDFYDSVVYSCELDGSIPIPPASVMYC